jgi:hypothetical protein
LRGRVKVLYRVRSLCIWSAEPAAARRGLHRQVTCTALLAAVKKDHLRRFIRKLLE